MVHDATFCIRDWSASVNLVTYMKKKSKPVRFGPKLLRSSSVFEWEKKYEEERV